MRTRWIIASLIALEGALLLAPAMRSLSSPAPETVARPSLKSESPAAPLTAAETQPLAQPSVDPRRLPVVEPVEVIAEMSRAELEATIIEIDVELERSDAIHRLNEGKVSNEERVEIGALLERGSLMRNQLARLDLQALERAVAEYEAGHAARVAQFAAQSH